MLFTFVIFVTLLCLLSPLFHPPPPNGQVSFWATHHEVEERTIPARSHCFLEPTTSMFSLPTWCARIYPCALWHDPL